MQNGITENETFNRQDYTPVGLPEGEYSHCTFNECNLADSDLSGIVFTDCIFSHCNLSMTKLKNTTLSNVQFDNCKLLGLHFNDCNKFLLSPAFRDCQLNYSIFYQLKLKKIRFANCSLEETDFSQADLAGAVFEHCNMNLAVFDNTILEGADLRSAYNYSIDPEKNRLRKARFSAAGLAGLLYKYQILIE
jgi:uncharacterized protein YjbI with pentapeptide repeats